MVSWEEEGRGGGATSMPSEVVCLLRCDDRMTRCCVCFVKEALTHAAWEASPYLVVVLTKDVFFFFFSRL